MINIKKIRELRKITQVELAQKLDVQQSAIAAWETGKSMPRADRFIKIAEVLDCTIDELLDNSNLIDNKQKSS